MVRIYRYMRGCITRILLESIINHTIRKEDKTMSEKTTINKVQIVQFTVEILENIAVPVKMKKMVSDPIADAIQNLLILREMMIAEEQQKAEEAQAEEKPTLEIVKEEPGDEAVNDLPEAGEQQDPE